jgi:hypothetical protein
VARGRVAAGAVGADDSAVGFAVTRGARKEEMADGPTVRVGLDRYCRIGLGPRPN